MALEEYEVDWQPELAGGAYSVKLMIEPELVTTAKLEGRGIEETPSRLEIGRRVRNAVAVSHPQVRTLPVFFDDLTIRLRS